MLRPSPLVTWSALLLVSPFAGGCGGGKPAAKDAPAAYENLRKISSAYLQATNGLNRPPRSLDEIMTFLGKDGNPEEILRSPEDGEPYVILWGVDYRTVQPGPGGFPVLAYEQRGKGGKRYVLQVRNVSQLSDEEFKRAPFPPGHKPPF